MRTCSASPKGICRREGTDYLRLKAIEALGPLRTPGTETALRKIARHENMDVD